ncbi:MAG: Gfo/Idh/MocA family oxidoreductase [Lentisphaeria bacterium]|nr:Gfo/Idh/MocA family oxidoreductase [Lentisphaeria bacterium]NQZ67191.1 Gfo/Idh/MocA family oxidoreductase [Lentisphaeria bacterium]
MSKWKIGIIGAGGITAKLHMPELNDLKDRAEVVLVSGRRDSRLEYFQKEYGVPRKTNDYDDVINDDEVDIVIIATPHMQHVNWGLKSLNAGKHIMMQKPLSGLLSECDDFVSAAEDSDKIVFCLPHYSSAIHHVRKLVDEGGIGKVTGAWGRASHGGPEIYYKEVCKIFGEPEPEELWFFDEQKAGVGALFDMGVYPISNLVAALGTVKSVSGIISTMDKPTTLEDTATILLHFENGATGIAETSWCDPGRTWGLRINGSESKIEFQEYGNKATHYKPTSNDSDNALINETSLDVKEIGTMHKHFLDCLDAGVQAPLSNVWNARHITEIMLKGLEAGKSGKRLDIVSEAKLIN